MSNYIEDIYKQLKELKRHERIMVLLMMLIEIIEREYFLVQKLKQEISEYEKEVRPSG
jgi:flavoprotein